jgi:AhpD family alkylhydroperoxidase
LVSVDVHPAVLDHPHSSAADRDSRRAVLTSDTVHAHWPTHQIQETKMNEVARFPRKATAQRANYAEQSPELLKKFTELLAATRDGAIEESIRDLAAVRAAQMNGCTFCLDMHVKQAKIHGERELRLYHLAAWRDSPLFAPRERAALAWTEALTSLPEQGVPDEIYDRVRTQLSEKEVSDLTFVIMVVNSWNRLNIGFKTMPGSGDARFGLDSAGLH